MDEAQEEAKVLRKFKVCGEAGTVLGIIEAEDYWTCGGELYFSRGNKTTGTYAVDRWASVVEVFE